MRSNGEESTSVDEALTSTAGTAVPGSRDGQSGACDRDICRLSVCVVAKGRSCQNRSSIRLPRSAPQQFLSRRIASRIRIRTEIMKRLGLPQPDGSWAGSQPPLRRLTRSDERTASIGNTDKPRLSGMQILGHNCRETLATAMSTGVVSRATQLLARLTRQALHRPAGFEPERN